MTSSSSDYILPSILSGDNILLPVKIDITISGARYVDTFCWKLYNSLLTPDQFAWRLCTDLNLPITFQSRISLQISEQIVAFQEIITLLRLVLSKGIQPPWSKLLHVTIGIRHNTLDYSDKFQWDIVSQTGISPESFAATTCADLGLPSDMEPAIAHKIRENIFRSIVSWLDDINNPVQADFKNIQVMSDTKVMLVQPNQAIDMVVNLCKRAKPSAIEDQAAIPQPMLPANKDTNAYFWNKK
jgi:hypothetical protein